MCSHTECQVEVLPDGQVDETHVFTLEELQEFLEKIREMPVKPRVLDIPPEVPEEYWPTDLRLRGWGKGGD